MRVVLVLVLSVCMIVCVAGTSRAGVVVEADYLLFKGPFHLQRALLFLRPAPERASIRIDLPPSPLLPDRLVFVKDGAHLLHWVEPASGRDPLAENHEIARLLETLDADGWEALITGRKLDRLIEAQSASPADGDVALRGRLADWEASLRTPGRDTRGLVLRRGDEAWALNWRDLPQARRTILDISTPDGVHVRVKSRFRRERSISDEQWLFVAAGGR